MISRDAPVQVVLTTFGDAASADEVVATLVAERLVACGQRSSAAIRSMYPWQGEIHAEDEVLVVLKTLERCLPALEGRLTALHPYDVPEFVVLPAQASASYLAWMQGWCDPEPA